MHCVRCRTDNPAGAKFCIECGAAMPQRCPHCGAPLAHEDHAHRALYAALRMQEEMRRYGEQRRRAGGAPLLLRVGVNTGEKASVSRFLFMK